MIGIDKITARIESEAKEAADVIRAQAQTQAADIAAEFEKEAAAARASILERGTIKAQEREEGLISLAQMETKKMVLAAKQEVLDKAFALAGEKLAALPKDQKLQILSEMAVKASSTGTESVLLNARDREQIGDSLVVCTNEKLKKAGRKHELTLSEETADISGGMILKDKKVEVNCSFETLLRLNKKEIAGQVAGLLFS